MKNLTRKSLQKLSAWAIIVLTSTVLSAHAEDIALSGTVVDDGGIALEGVTVSLEEYSMSATTDLQGVYSIDGQTTTLSTGTSNSPAELISVAGKQLTLTMVESGKAQFELYSIRGQQLRKNQFSGVAGERKNIDLSSLSKGMYLYTVSTGISRSRGKLLVSGNSMAINALTQTPPLISRGTRASTGTLTFSKYGYISQSVSLSSLNEQIDVTLESDSDASTLFTERDMNQNPDVTDAVSYTLNSNEDIVITEPGIYVISGTASNSSIIVETADTSKVQIILDGVSITNENAPGIYVKSADKVFLTTAENSENSVTFTGAAIQEISGVDTTSIDGAIFSKDDLVFNGLGTLTVVSEQTNGIVSKDDLKITGGTISITAAEDALEANDSIRIGGGIVEIAAGKDGIHAENDEVDELGYVYISAGEITINAEDEGIVASSTVEINGGTVTIPTSNVGIKGDAVSISDGTIEITANEVIDGIDTIGGHGIKVTDSITITGGKTTITAEKDGIHAENDTDLSLGNVTITNGDITITAGDDAILASNSVTIDGGTTTIVESKDGIEGRYIVVSNGTVDINGSDDGIYASDSIGISGGEITVVAGTDAIHAENETDNTVGSIYISGGTVTVTGGTAGTGGDGIQATTYAQFEGGTVTVSTTVLTNVTEANRVEGVEATYILINDGDITILATDDGFNASAKSSLYHTPLIEVNGGTISVEMVGKDTDGFDSNGNLTVTGGIITVDYEVNGPSGAFDADGTITYTGGTVTVNGEVVTELGESGGNPWGPF